MQYGAYGTERRRERKGPQRRHDISWALLGVFFYYRSTGRDYPTSVVQARGGSISFENGVRTTTGVVWSRYVVILLYICI